MNTELCEFTIFEENGVAVNQPEEKINVVSLRTAVEQAINNLVSGAPRYHETIINDVQGDQIVSANRGKLSRMISALLDIVVDNSEDNVIHVSAKTIGRITLMHFRNSQAEFTSQIAALLRELESLAESLGGCVTVSSNRMYGLCLVFTFLNH